MTKIYKIYATSCERDRKNFFDVPEKLQDKVRELIEADGYVINEDGTVVNAATQSMRSHDLEPAEGGETWA